MATVLLRSEETAGVLSVIELSSEAGWGGPPLHRHDFDEAFYVIEGELTFQLGEEVFTRGPGELAFAPRTVAHTYANHSDGPARAMLVCTPAGFERYFARMKAEREGVEPPAWALQPTPPVEHLGPQIARGG
jgi:quercetin dioxygenase-like cupin family protein